MKNTEKKNTEKPKYECSGTVKDSNGDEITVSCKGDNLEELLENVKKKIMEWFK